MNDANGLVYKDGELSPLFPVIILTGSVWGNMHGTFREQGLGALGTS